MMILTMELGGSKKPARSQYVWTASEAWPVPFQELILIESLYVNDAEFILLQLFGFIEGDYERREWETFDGRKARAIAAFCRARCAVRT